jgi:hypothetical protein
MKLVKTTIGLAALGLLGLVATSFTARAQDKPAAKEELVPAQIKLPVAAFTGTPKNFPKEVEMQPEKPRPLPMWPKGATNLALNQPVTSSDNAPSIGDLKMITDGDKEAKEGSYVELGPGRQWVQVDLGASVDIYGVLVWHYHSEPRVYKAVVVQVSDDKDFVKDVKTIYNNDADEIMGFGQGTEKQYLEYFGGRLIDLVAKKMPTKARYVRFWSAGNTNDDQNHYTEVEVWGKK